MTRVLFGLLLLLAASTAGTEVYQVQHAVSFLPWDQDSVVAWWECDTTSTLHEDPVDTWVNRMISAGTAGDWTQGTAAHEMDFVPNVFSSGACGIRGDNSADHLELTTYTFSDSSALSLWIVVKWDGDEIGADLVTMSAGSITDRLACGSGGPPLNDYFARVDNTSIFLTNSGDDQCASQTGQVKKLEIYRETNGDWYIFEDGTDITATTPGNDTGPWDIDLIGCNATESACFDHAYGIVGWATKSYRTLSGPGRQDFYDYMEDWAG